jgi:hypothetical protein
MRVRVDKCEIVIVFGHGSQKNPWNWHPGSGCSGGAAIVCWPGANSNGLLPEEDLYPNKPETDCQIHWGSQVRDPNNPNVTKFGQRPLADDIFDQVYKNAEQRAQELCKKNCCSKVRVRFIWISKDVGDDPIENPRNKDTDYEGKLKIQDYVFDCKTQKKIPVAR